MTTTNRKSSNHLHPLNLLAQVISRNVSGCLQVSYKTISWSFYLEQGELLYASHSIDPFERLDRHLLQLSPTLSSAIRGQMRLLFETVGTQPVLIAPEYQAICWLVRQQHLDRTQAFHLIEVLSQETISAFLKLRVGNYQFIESNHFAKLPKFCQLNLRLLVEQCQNQRKPSSFGKLLKREKAVKIASITPIKSVFSQAASDNVKQAAASDESKIQRSTQDIQKCPEPSRSFIDYPQRKTIKLATSPAKKAQHTIACIDDDPVVLQTITSFLDDAKFLVVPIGDPLQSLMQIAQSHPDLILLDTSMPTLSGYKLCSMLRKHPSFKQTPIVMITESVRLIDRAKTKLIKASGYLHKPFTQSELLNVISKYLQ